MYEGLKRAVISLTSILFIEFLTGSSSLLYPEFLRNFSSSFLKIQEITMPATLINVFIVPADKEEEFLANWKKTANKA